MVPSFPKFAARKALKDVPIHFEMSKDLFVLKGLAPTPKELEGHFPSDLNASRTGLNYLGHFLEVNLIWMRLHERAVHTNSCSHLREA